MNKKMIFAGVFVFFSLTVRAEAANLAVITSPPTLLHFVILGISVAGVLGSLKVLNLVRGGQLSRSWQYFAAAFFVLVLCQIATLGGSFGILALPSFVIPFCLVVMTGLFLMGIRETKRALS